MKKLLWPAALLLPPALSLGQSSAEKVEWLRSHAAVIDSIDVATEDFGDLKPLAAAIGDAQVVMLGEQTHGDGAAFLAKSRLVRFLHEQMGFDVLVWESGTYDCWRANEAMRDPRIPVHDAGVRGVFSVWADSAQAAPVLEYVRQTQLGPRAIEMAGLDPQFSAPASIESYPAYVAEFFNRVEPGEVSDADLQRLRASVKSLTERNYLASESESQAFRAWLHGLADRSYKSVYRRYYTQRQLQFMRRTLWNVLQFEAVEQGSKDKSQLAMEFMNYRDRVMAENLEWLARTLYAGRKLIVWAASSHTAYRPRPGVRSRDLYEPMGSFVQKTFGERVYSLAFLAYSGQEGRLGRPANIEPAPEGSIDQLLHALGKPYLFVDIKSAPQGNWLRQRTVARPYGYSNEEGIWPEHFDGFFFTDVMTPSTLSRKSK